MDKPPKPKIFKVMRLVFIGLVAAVLAVVSIFIAGVMVDLPDMSELENPKSDLSTQVFSSDGQLIRSLYSEEHRVSVALHEISPNVLNSLVAAEDVRFFQHSGVDPKSLFAVLKDALLKGKIRGGSTITMQLARNLYERVGKKRSGSRKLKEMIVAVILERKYTKEEIITSYLNTVSFVGNTYGIQNGARTYFQKDAIDLNVEEAAVLVGMLKATNDYNPVKHYDRSLARRNTILAQMESYGFLEKDEADSISNLPIDLASYRQDDHNIGLAAHFTEHLRKWLSVWCAEKGFDLYKDGLRVFTTIDSRMQRYAEKAVYDHLEYLQGKFDKHIKGKEAWRKDSTILNRLMYQSHRHVSAKRSGASKEEIWKEFSTPVEMTVFSYRGAVDTLLSPWDSLKYYSRFLESGMISIDPSSGHIKAWVGGLDHRFFKYDHVYLGKRQVGSTFKPFVYTAAFDNGYSPCSRELNQPVFFYKETGELEWAPKNSDGKFGGYMTLRRGLATSTNLITARLMKKIGADVVCQYAYNMGIQSKLECVPSLALGTTDLSVYELTGAYCTFANNGVWNEPIFVTRIEDKQGNLIQEFVGDKREAINEETAYLMLNMLMGVVDEPGGTAGRLRFMYKFTNQIGGKTGTTQNHSDGWFMGVTPYLTSGVWVGCSDRSMRFRSMEYGQGSRLAMPVFADYMKEVYADSTIGLPKDPFHRPRGLKVQLDCSRYVYSDGEINPEDTTGGSKSMLNFED